MTSFKFLGATFVLSALLATPASAYEAISEPAAASAQDPTFSVYSNDGPGFSRTMASQAPLGDASGLHHMSVGRHRGNHTAGVKRY
jgi:hypothetical protein